MLTIPKIKGTKKNSDRSKIYTLRNIFTPLLIIVILSSCEILFNPDSDNEQRITLEYSKADSTEAVEFAIWLSGELEAPDSLVSELLYNLNYLRYKYGNDYPIVNDAGRFLPPWKLDRVLCNVDSATASLINDDAYTSWDILPLSLQPDTMLRYPDILGWCSIGFDEMYHPRRLAEIYSTLPGFLICAPSIYGFVGGAGFHFFPGLHGGAISYLYPSPAGMIQYYYYFRYQGDEPTLIGIWDISNESEPDWWPEASLNKYEFAGWDGWPDY